MGKTVYTTNQCFSDGTRSTKLICSSLSCVQNAYSNTDCSGAESSVLATYALNTPCVQTSSPTLFPYVKQTLSVGVPSPLPSATPAPASTPSLTGDLTALCDFYKTVPAAGQSYLKFWCGSSGGTYDTSACIFGSTSGPKSWTGVTFTTVAGTTRVTGLYLS